MGGKKSGGRAPAAAKEKAAAGFKVGDSVTVNGKPGRVEHFRGELATVRFGANDSGQFSLDEIKPAPAAES